MKILNPLLTAIFSILITTNSSYAFNISAERNYDFNDDNKIDGFDWIQMSAYDKNDLIVNYHDYSFKTMPISDNLKEREINKIVTVLNYYYKSDNSENRKTGVWDTYQLIVE